MGNGRFETAPAAVADDWDLDAFGLSLFRHDWGLGQLLQYRILAMGREVGGSSTARGLARQRRDTTYPRSPLTPLPVCPLAALRRNAGFSKAVRLRFPAQGGQLVRMKRLRLRNQSFNLRLSGCLRQSDRLNPRGWVSDVMVGACGNGGARTGGSGETGYHGAPRPPASSVSSTLARSLARSSVPRPCG